MFRGKLICVFPQNRVGRRCRAKRASIQMLVSICLDLRFGYLVSTNVGGGGWNVDPLETKWVEGVGI